MGGQINTANYTIGQCSLYYTATIAHASLLSADFRTDARSLGNIVTAEITPDVTYIEHFISDNGQRKRDFTAVSEIKVSIPFTFDEMNSGNIQKFFLGSLLATDRIAPFEEPLVNGCAQLYFTTNVGQDLVYYIPKCTIRPDGGMAMNAEDWWTANMVIDVWHYDTSDWASKPYGYMSTSSIA